MTNLFITHIPAPTPTGFTKQQTIGGIKLLWDNLTTSAASSYLLYSSTINDRDTATLVAEVSETDYFYATTDNTTIYFWLRCRSAWGQVNGDWSSGVNAGLSSQTELVRTVDVIPNAISNFIIAESVGVNNIVSPYSAYAPIFNTSFTSSGGRTIIDASYDNLSATFTSNNLNTMLARVYQRNLLIDNFYGGSDTSLQKTVFGSSQVEPHGDSNPWQNLANINTADLNQYADVTWSATGKADGLYLYNYDFSAIPDDAYIYDVKLEIVMDASNISGVPKVFVRLCWDGSDFPTKGGDDSSLVGYNITASATKLNYTFGGLAESNLSWAGRFIRSTATDLHRISVADVKDSKFGIRIFPTNDISPAGTTLKIYRAAITVSYTTKKVIWDHAFATNLYRSNYAYVFNPYKTLTHQLENNHNYTYRIDAMAETSTPATDIVNIYAQNCFINVQEVKR